MSWSRIAYEYAAANGIDPTKAVTSGVTTTGATLGIAIVGTYSGGGGGVPGGSDVTDAASNTWTKLTNVDSGSVCLSIYYTVPAAVGLGHFVTFQGPTCYPALQVIWFSGVDTGTPFNSESAGGTSSSATSIQPGSAGVSGALAVTGEVTGKSSALSPSIGSSFTIETEVVGAAAVNVELDLAWKTISGAENPTWSWSGSENVASAMAIFNGAAGATTWGPLLGLRNNRLVVGN